MYDALEAHAKSGNNIVRILCGLEFAPQTDFSLFLNFFRRAENTAICLFETRLPKFASDA